MSHRWTPSIVPHGYDETVYLVVDCGEHGCVWREADVASTDLETVITDLLTAQYSDPLCVVAFNSSENWSRDVTADVAMEIKPRATWQMTMSRRGLRISSTAMSDWKFSCP